VLFWLRGFVDLQSTISRWHAARLKYGAVVDLFSSLARSEMPSPQYFLALVLAVEGYHRRSGTHYDLPSDEHQKIRERVRVLLEKECAETAFLRGRARKLRRNGS
jgi:hypothetical protein